jgi:hypothetical protein
MNIKSSDKDLHSKEEELYYAYKALPRMDSQDLAIDAQIFKLNEHMDKYVAEHGQLEEPDFHKRNKTMCMKLFPYLAERTKLSFDEIAFYYDMKTNMV